MSAVDCLKMCVVPFNSERLHISSKFIKPLCLSSPTEIISSSDYIALEIGDLWCIMNGKGFIYLIILGYYPCMSGGTKKNKKIFGIVGP